MSENVKSNKMDYINLSGLIKARAAKYKSRAAMKYRDYDSSQWIPISWNEFSETVDVCANALIEYNIEEQEKIGVFSQNKPECLFVDFGAYSNRAVTIPLYATSSTPQVEYIINDAKIRIVFVGEQYQYDTIIHALPNCPTLQKIIIFDTKVTKNPNDRISVFMPEFLRTGADKKHMQLVEKRRSESKQTDLVNILYTSGTTGEPKGVMLHQSNYTIAFKNHDERLTYMTDKDVSMNFLPMTHIFERAWVYLCFHKGVLVCINLKPTDIQMTIKEIRPTLMCSVPRFWEKVYSGVQDKIAATKGIKKTLMLDAIKVGKIHNIDYLSKGLTPPLLIRLKYRFYDKFIYSLLKKVIGIENGNFFPTAGAAVPDKVFEFCRAVGIRLIVGYGLTESTATVSFTDFDKYKIGSVGEIMPNVYVRIGENDEILLKGETITKGYYNKPEANKEAFTEDGWFRTGDAGRIEGNVLYLKDRIKDLFKTSNGKYIAPQAIETAIVIDQFIDQICIVADKRKFVSALIVPDYKNLTEYAKSKGIQFNDMTDLVKNEKINKMIADRIDVLQQNFAHFEQIKKFTLLPIPFSMNKGELTNTLKIKRQVVYNNYSDEINKMYE